MSEIRIGSDGKTQRLINRGVPFDMAVWGPAQARGAPRAPQIRRLWETGTDPAGAAGGFNGIGLCRTVARGCE